MADEDQTPTQLEATSPPRLIGPPPPLQPRVVDISPDMSQQNPNPALSAIQQTPRIYGATYNISGPGETFESPSYLARQQQEIMDIYKKAQNVKQAEQDVMSARRMLGILKADREIQSGVPVDKAMYNNLQFFVQPGDKNFVPAMKTLQPPPTPQVRQFPGTTIPPAVQMGPKLQWPSAAAMKAGAPAEENLPRVIELEGEKYIINPKTGHFERKDKGKTVETLTPGQMVQAANARAKILEASLMASNPEDKAELMEIRKALRGIMQGQRPKMPTTAPQAAPSAQTERVRVKSKEGKIGTIPKNQLEEAKKAGYSLVE
jgi:hypothetical protein